MGGFLPPIVAVLTANITQFQAKMAEAGATAAATTEGTSGKFAALAGAGKVALLGTAAVFGVVAGVGFELARKVEASGQAAFEMSEKYGLAKGAASQWMAVAQSLGVSSDVVGLGFRILGRNMEMVNLALENGKKPPAAVTESFRALGIHIFDTHGKLRDMSEVMKDVATKFASMPDGPEKAGLAMRLFGRSGASLIPILNEGRTGIDGLIASATKAGDVMSGPQVDAAHKAFLAQQQFNVAVGGLTTQLGIGLLPIMTKVFGWLASSGVPAIQNAVNWLGKNQDVIKYVAAALAGPLALAIGAYIISMGAAAVATIAATWPILLIIAALAAVGLAIMYAYNHWTGFRLLVNAIWLQVLKPFGQWLGKELPVAWQAVTKEVGILWNDLQNFGTWVKNTFGPILDNMGKAFSATGTFLNAINPWAKHSPSLVENVLSGTQVIARYYQDLSRAVDTSMRGITPGSAAVNLPVPGGPTTGALTSTPSVASPSLGGSGYTDPAVMRVLQSIDRTLTAIRNDPSSVSAQTLLRRLG